KLVSNVQPSFKDLDSPEDDPVIIVDDSKKDEELEKDEVHPTPNAETEDSSVPKSSSSRSSQIQELTNQFKKNKAEADAALLKAQLSFPNVSLPTELKDLPSKLNDLTEEVKVLKTQVYNLEIELPGDLKEISPKINWFKKLKTLDALLNLLLNVTQALNKFAQVFDSSSSTARDQGVPSADQAHSMPAEGEKNTNQATISQLFQQRAKKENLNNQQPKPTTPPATTIIPFVITTTTTQMQSPPP
ncbi:hypothetical protein Tco_1037994, partial [Tanacetum coccineum]